jgi:hypothetical protein
MAESWTEVTFRRPEGFPASIRLIVLPVKVKGSSSLNMADDPSYHE